MGTNKSTLSLPAGTRLNSIDIHQAGALIAELEPLLKGHRFDAIVRFKELQTLCNGTDIAIEIEPIDEALKMFKFDLALKHLRQLSITHSWQEAG
jgi:hypothetical protein